MHWVLYLIPVLFCSFAGWVATLVAMRTLFHPRIPVNLFGINFQGILPKNKELIIKQLAQAVNAAFLSSPIMEEKILDPANFEKLKPEIEKHIDIFLREKLKDSFPLISQFIGDKTINKLKTAFLTELETLFPALMKNYVTEMKQGIDLEKVITEKINAFSPSITTAGILSVTIKKEATLLQVRGAVAGFCIGLLQTAILLLFF